MKSQVYQLEIPYLPYTAKIDAGWGNHEGEWWQYHATLIINQVEISDIHNSQIDVTDLVLWIQQSELEVSAIDCDRIAKVISDFVLKKARETYPKTHAHDHYYGL